MTEILFATAAILAIGIAVFLKLRPSSMVSSKEALLARSLTQVMDGDRENALESMRLLYQTSNQNEGVGLALGVLLRRLGKTRLAIRTQRSLLERSGLKADLAAAIHAELAVSYLIDGQGEEARVAIGKALELGVLDEISLRNGEKVFTSLGAWEQAIRLTRGFGKSTRTEVSDRLALLHCGQGRALWDEGKLDQAFGLFKKALSLHPACQEACLWVARYHTHSGNPSKALGFLEKRAGVFKGDAWLWLKEQSGICLSTGDHRRFIDAAHNHLALEPDDWRSRSVLGRFHMETGDYEEAVQAFLSCLESAPDILLVHRDLWELLRREGSPEGTLKTYLEQSRGNGIPEALYECRCCGQTDTDWRWTCPACQRIYCFTERRKGSNQV